MTERIESFNEVELMIRQAAARHGTHPVIRRINGEELGFGNSVSRAIECLPGFYESHHHVIVLATHAALLLSDFSGFQGWRIVIDEVPQFLDFKQLRTHLDAAFFQRFYHVTPFAEGWGTITLTEAGQALSVANIRKDESHEHLKVFHARIVEASRLGAKRRVLCNLSRWDAMADEEVQWCWASAFSIRELEAFDRVEMLGNRFRRDIGCQLTRALDGEEVEWESLPVRSPWSSFAQRAVHIRYFSEVQAATKSYFESDEGQAVLAAIGKLLRNALPPGNSI